MIFDLYLPGSVSCKNYMIFDLFMVQCHVRSTWSLICISWFMSCKNYMISDSCQDLHDLWSVSPHGSVSCKNYMIFDVSPHGSVSCQNYMIFDMYLFTIQCHVRTTWSLICISSWFSVMFELPDLWSVSPHGSVSCKNYMIFDLDLFTVQCHVHTTWSLISISSWFSVM